MQIILSNNKSIVVSLATLVEAGALHNYFLKLSPLTQSRYAPHSFDSKNVTGICRNNGKGYAAYIATDTTNKTVVAYMLLKQVLLLDDFNRYASRNQFYLYTETVSFAPSVADDWQSSGLGREMNQYIELQLRSQQQRHIILWGGVQAANEKALNFYKKQGYQQRGDFWLNGVQNLDMIKTLY
jgi:hypothetical protein